ncbi:tetratricopeptide repeat protein 25 [Orussus abietinus]|uniref:tetratricopeptide repeat protein 25 n=1 Tax=Orussus abietinus TaxID=222816 RepID=UPI0006269BF8|nr:tetratricopeptide repeat protein 25 [Orussus abietinus]
MANSGEQPEIFRAAILYREWGWRLFKLEKHADAMKMFQKSITFADTNDIRTLLGLSIVLARLTEYLEAAKVVDKLMEIDPQNYKVKWERVDSLFKIAEFGYSMIHAYQGLRKRRYPFEWGIFQGNETIEDCVGRNTSPIALRELFPWIKEMQRERKIRFSKLAEEEDDDFVDTTEVDEEQARFIVNDPETKREIHLKMWHRILAQTYLGHLARDKYFLDECIDNPNLRSANKNGSDDLCEMVERCYDQSEYRQEILRIRKPFYVFRFMRKARPLGHKAMIWNEKQIRRHNIVLEANFLLLRLHNTRMQRDYPLFFRYVDRTKVKFDSYPDDMFPLKRKCLNTVYKMAAWAYIDPRNLTDLPDERTKLRYLRHHIGFRVGKLPRNSQLAWVPTLDRKAALGRFRIRLAMASEALELAWLFHELSKLLVEIRRFDLARFYAKKARDAGIEAKSDQWTLNANHILVRIEIYQHNRNEAREAAQVALSTAVKLDLDYLVDFYKRAIKLVEKIDLDKVVDTDSIAIREKAILDLMPEEKKTEVDFLLRSMNVVPAKRRLSVMPGCKTVNHKYQLPCKRNTILPSSPKNPEKEARTKLLNRYAHAHKVLGSINFSKYE